MTIQQLYFIRRSPFLRLIIPLVFGIISHWYFRFALPIWTVLILSGIFCFVAFFYIPFFSRFSRKWLAGIFVFVILYSLGGILTYHNDVRNNRMWFGNSLNETEGFIAVIDETLIEKARSFKANARIKYIYSNAGWVASEGSAIIYFSKDSLNALLDYGAKIVVKKPLVPIKGSGNPGGFDYGRYSLFQGITHQVFLKHNEFFILEGKETTFLKSLLINIRDRVLFILRKYIKGEKEIGLAEALLIGYKNDLDKSLVQSYSNTGVVHVIAISGLHIGLIYWLLVLIMRPLKKNRTFKWLEPVLVLIGLWGFSLLAGAQPSVLRSAVMFSCIVLSNTVARKSSIYNTLAFSAFILLCYNPYWLWDAGFQLSYTAVLSIIIFMKPVYNLIFVKNKLLDMIWKLNAVTLSAQILTVPVSIFHFHQFPNYFILTNIVAVPLSSAIVLGEILLCVVSFIPGIAFFIGKLLGWGIWIMNSYIEIIERFPASIWQGLQIDIVQTILLYILIVFISVWLSSGRIYSLIAGMVCLLLFFIIRSISFFEKNSQAMLVIYNVAGKSVADIFIGREVLYLGDSTAQEDEFVGNFHLKPSRILHRTSVLPADIISQGRIVVDGKKILIVEKSIGGLKEKIDVMILNRNSKVYLKNAIKKGNVEMVVFDASVSQRRLYYWKKDCDSLGIPYHDVAEKGAFVMNLN